MVAGLWGRKVGMTQVFSQGKVIPVTVIDAANWFVTQIKSVERDGYNAVQLGLLRDRYVQQEFSADWLKALSKYFMMVREIPVDTLPEGLQVGSRADFYSTFAQGDRVDAFGNTKGCGFAGVIRRHGFNGPRASHGDTMGRRPGSMGYMRSQGRVIKGKKLPGHMGVEQQAVKNLTVVTVDQDARLILVKGSVPGKPGTLIFVRKAV